MPAKTVKKLELQDCRDIIKSYKFVINPAYNKRTWLSRNIAWYFESDISSIKYLFTGTFYKGKHARSAFIDYLAGGSTNNFAFNCSNHNYGNFIYFLDTLSRYRPSAPGEETLDVYSILDEMHNAQNTESLRKIVKQYKQYVPTKCYYDLKADFNGKADYYNTGDRLAETQSRRISKSLSMLYAICQGFIEIMGFKEFSFFASIITLGIAPPVAIFVFLIAFSVNYALSREETQKTFKKIITGHFYERNVGTAENEKYESYSTVEKVAVSVITFLAPVAGISLYGLGVSSLIAPIRLGALVLTAPAWFAYGLPLCLIVPASIIFANSLYKFVEEKGWEKLANYFENILPKNWYDVKGIARFVLWEIPKLLISLLISGAICIITFNMLRPRSALYLGDFMCQSIADGLSTIASGITAGLKSLFCVSKTSELIESASESITNSLCDNKNENEDVKDTTESPSEVKNTKQMMNALEVSASRCDKVVSTIKGIGLGVHSVSEAGVAIDTTGNVKEGIIKGVYALCTNLKSFFYSNKKHAVEAKPAAVNSPSLGK